MKQLYRCLQLKAVDRNLAFLSEQRKRTSFSWNQLSQLEKEYEITPYPSFEKKLEICERVKLDANRVTVWFQNRRMKQKRMEMLKQYTPQQREMLNNKWIPQ